MSNPAGSFKSRTRSTIEIGIALKKALMRAQESMDDLLRRILNCKDDIEDVPLIADVLFKKESTSVELHYDELQNCFFYKDYEYDVYKLVYNYLVLYDKIMSDIHNLIESSKIPSFNINKFILQKRMLFGYKHELRFAYKNIFTLE